MLARLEISIAVLWNLSLFWGTVDSHSSAMKSFTFLRYCRFPQKCWWSFHSSKILRPVDWCVGTNFRRLLLPPSSGLSENSVIELPSMNSCDLRLRVLTLAFLKISVLFITRPFRFLWTNWRQQSLRNASTCANLQFLCFVERAS